MLVRVFVAFGWTAAIAAAQESVPATGARDVQTGNVGALVGGVAGLTKASGANVAFRHLTLQPPAQIDTPATVAPAASSNSGTTGGTGSSASGIADQTTPFSVWLDIAALSKPGAAKPSLPIWFDSFQTETVPAKDGAPPSTAFRLRLRRMPSLHHELLLRVFFDDLPDLQPVVTAWTESGREKFRSPALGSGVCLPSSESVVVPIDGADYVDVEVPGNGSNIRGLLASSLKEITTRGTIDFQEPAEVADPFGNAAQAQPAAEDSKLFGRVKATVDTGVVQLSRKENASGVWEFHLAGQPLAAMVTFEVLNADFTAPPVVAANDSEPGVPNVQWPDLADPGFRGEARPLEPGLRFQYTGWVRAQFAIPGHLLRSGLNQIAVSLSDDSGPIAIRNVELQLKQNWKHFDYLLTPANQ